MADSLCLAGRTALVTGGAKRLGRALCCALAEAGANVVVHYGTSQDEAEAVRAELAGLGVSAWTLSADLAKPDEAEDLLAAACEQAGPIDILINNASVFPEATLADCTAEEIAACMNVNAYAPLAISRRFSEQGRDGAIVNLLDCRIADYDAAHVPYHLSKRALFALTRMMALEFAPQVRVNGIAPGLILPPAGKDEAYLAELASTNPLNRYGGPDDIVSAALFLLESPFITGQVIYVDGGRHMIGNVYG